MSDIGSAFPVSTCWGYILFSTETNPHDLYKSPARWGNIRHHSTTKKKRDMMKNTHLTDEERRVIGQMRGQGCSTAEIANALGRARSTIWRHANYGINWNGKYDHQLASKRARGRKMRTVRPHKLKDELLAIVIDLLRAHLSPEQIGGWLKRHTAWRISHETIYRFIRADRKAGGTLYTHLRQYPKRRQRRVSRGSRRKILNKRDISERPEVVESQGRVGDWEIDTVVGPTGTKGCIVTMVERKTGYVVIGKLKDKKAVNLNARVLKLLKREEIPVYTITADNGSEFHWFKGIERKTDVTFYFAKPYHSWERGLNENTNGLIRQYIPKGMGMDWVTQPYCICSSTSIKQQTKETF